MSGGRTMRHEVNVEGAKLAIGGAGVLVWGMTLNEWVAVATIAYFVMQMAYLAWKWRKEAKKK